MRAHPSGITAILEIASAELDHQLNSSQVQNKDELMNIIQNYLSYTITYEKAVEAFEALDIREMDTLDKMKEIKSVEEQPLPTATSYDNLSMIDSGFVNSPSSSDLSMSSSSSNMYNHKKSRPWSSIEDLRLLAGILRYGLENWSTVAMFVGNDRSRAQCSQRWSRGLNPKISKDTWSPDEENLLIRLIQQFGDKSWTKIASLLGNRSDVQCRYHFHQINKNSQALAFGSPNPPPPPPNQTAPPYRNLDHIQTHIPSVRQPPRFSLPNVTFSPLMVSPAASSPHMLPPIPSGAASSLNVNINRYNTNLDNINMNANTNINVNMNTTDTTIIDGYGINSDNEMPIPNINSLSSGFANTNTVSSGNVYALPTLNSKFKSISAGAVDQQQHFAGPSQIATMANSSDFDLEEINIDGFLRRFQ